jgi:translation initiation factor 3 subunit L
VTKAGRALHHHDHDHDTLHPTDRPISITMSLRERVPPQFQNGEAARRAPDDESDVEEEAMANDYKEQVQYDGMDDMDRMPSMTNNQDIHAQLQAAATPLEFQATLETKFASYDSYCNLFHYILNSEGPVDLEVPNVRKTGIT